MASTPSTRWVAPGHCQPAQQPIWQTCDYDSAGIPQHYGEHLNRVSFRDLVRQRNYSVRLRRRRRNARLSRVERECGRCATLATAGQQKWSLVNGTWKIDYVLQDGLNIGVPYSVVNYPAALNPATDGCRNIAGKAQPRRNGDHLCGDLNDQHERDQGAEPNKLVKVTDLLSATTLPTADGDHDRDDRIGHFVTIHSAKVGEVSRGVALAPKNHDDNDDRL
jgi:hypothetical protein